jgi:hypothetical protein
MKQMEWEQFQMLFAILAKDANAAQIYSFEAVGDRRSSKRRRQARRFELNLAAGTCVKLHFVHFKKGGLVDFVRKQISSSLKSLVDHGKFWGINLLQFVYRSGELT